MIVTEDSKRFFCVKDSKAIVVNTVPEGLSVHAGHYAYVVDTDEEHRVSFYMADSDEEAIEKAKKNIAKFEHSRAYVGMYLGTDANTRYFKDLNCLRFVEDKELNEEISDATGKEVAKEFQRMGLKFINAKGNEKLNILGAMATLNQAQSANTDTQARRLLNLSRRISAGASQEI